jgi:hypothetical protein
MMLNAIGFRAALVRHSTAISVVRKCSKNGGRVDDRSSPSANQTKNVRSRESRGQFGGVPRTAPRLGPDDRLHHYATPVRHSLLDCSGLPRHENGCAGMNSSKKLVRRWAWRQEPDGTGSKASGAQTGAQARRRHAGTRPGPARRHARVPPPRAKSSSAG